MRRAYAQRRVKTGDAFTRRILATIISIARLVGMGGVGVSVASAEEDATAVDTSAVIEPQAGQQEVRAGLKPHPSRKQNSRTKTKLSDRTRSRRNSRLNRMALPQSKVMPPSQTTLLPNKTMPIPFSQSRSPTISRLRWRLSRPLWRIKYNRPRRVRQAPSSWRRLSRTAISLITPAGR